MMIKLGRGLSPDMSPKPTGIAAIRPETVFELQAQKAASYPGSGQSWSSLQQAGGYQFYRGATDSASTDDPTFNGTADTAAAYWSFDGGDRFKLAAGSNPAFFNKLHNNTASWWVAMAFRTPAVISTTMVLFSTQESNSASSHGFSLYMASTSGGTLRYMQANGSSTFQTLGALSGSTDYLVVLSYDHASNLFNVWLNTRTRAQVTTVFGAATSDAASTCSLGTYGGGNNPVFNGTRLYGLAGGPALISSNTDAGLIYDYFNALHGRTYA